MHEFLNFIISVMASVAANYISKWLDGEDDQPSNKRPRDAARGFCCSTCMSNSSILPKFNIARVPGFVKFFV